MQFCDHLNYRGSHTRQLWENIIARSSSQSILSNRLSLKYYIINSIYTRSILNDVIWGGCGIARSKGTNFSVQLSLIRDLSKKFQYSE